MQQTSPIVGWQLFGATVQNIQKHPCAPYASGWTHSAPVLGTPEALKVHEYVVGRGITCQRFGRQPPWAVVK